MARGKPTETAIEITALNEGVLDFHLRGTSPLFYHRFAVKAWHELVYPSGKKTIADRAGSLKHDPLEEYRQSVYAHIENDHPTRFYFPGSAFRRSMSSAALRIPGVTKTAVSQLAWVNELKVDMYGMPSLSMMMVRNSDMNRTPDVRTRLVLEEWACKISVRFAQPILNERNIVNLIGAAGKWMGIGDGRGEKGIFHFGAFDVVDSDDPAWHLIVTNGGRAAQEGQQTEGGQDHEIDPDGLVTKGEAVPQPEPVVGYHPSAHGQPDPLHGVVPQAPGDPVELPEGDGDGYQHQEGQPLVTLTMGVHPEEARQGRHGQGAYGQARAELMPCP